MIDLQKSDVTKDLVVDGETVKGGENRTNSSRGTVLPAEWVNSLIMEFQKVLGATGRKLKGTLAEGSTQLYDSLIELFDVAPVATGRVLVKYRAEVGGTPENPQQYLKWERYSSGKVTLHLEGSLPFPASGVGGAALEYGMYDITTNAVLVNPWGVSCGKAIYTSATHLNSVDVPTPIMITVGTPFEMVGTKLAIKQMEDVLVSGKFYGLYTHSLVAAAGDFPLEIHAFSTVI